jgi:hypothetical protein
MVRVLGIVRTLPGGMEVDDPRRILPAFVASKAAAAVEFLARPYPAAP